MSNICETSGTMVFSYLISVLVKISEVDLVIKTLVITMEKVIFCTDSGSYLWFDGEEGSWG